MVKLQERLFIGGETSCRAGGGDLAVVHACKSPCHQSAVGYRGSLPSHHPHYLVLRRGFDLFLNMIDPPQPLFKLPVFTEFLSFSRQHWDEGRSLLIHCNQGESRAPSLALIFLVKHLKVLPDASFGAASRAFTILYPGYRPGAGIRRFLEENWPLL